MSVFQVLSRQGRKGKQLLDLKKCGTIQNVSIRKQCIYSLNCCAQNKLLSCENKNVSKLFKRHSKIQERSDIGLHYPRKKKIPRKGSLIDDISHGLEVIKEDIPKFKEEMKEKFMFDNDIFPEHGDFEYFKRFNGKDSVKDWMVSTDQDDDQGKSRATLTTTSTGTALFQGILSTEVPKDGISSRAGYCNMRSPLNKVRYFI